MVKYALLVGINYLLTPSLKLNGSYNDVLYVFDYITKYAGFKKDNILILTDILDIKKKEEELRQQMVSNEDIENENIGDDENIDFDDVVKDLYGDVTSDDSVLDATFFSIVKSIKQFARILTEEDSLFIYFSGHGGNIKDENGDEKDKKDEIFLPSDFSKHVITDDLIKELLKKFTTTIFIMIDACNSGSICDLKYKYNIKEKVFSENIYDTEDQLLMDSSNIVSLSSCEDDEESYEKKYEIAENIFKYHSSFTYKFFSLLEDNYKNTELPTYNNLFKSIIRLNDINKGVLYCNKKDLIDISLFEKFNERIKKKKIEEKNNIYNANINILRSNCEKLTHDNKKLVKRNKVLKQRLDAYNSLYGNNKNMTYNFNNLLYARALNKR